MKRDYAAIESIGFFDAVHKEVNEIRDTIDIRQCHNIKHSSCGSLYPSHSVPSRFFANPYNDEYYKTCLACREYIKKCRTTPDTTPDEYGLFECKQCKSLRTEDICEKCMYAGVENTQTRIINDHLLTWEKILEIGCCCERCGLSFKQKENGTPGFDVLKGPISDIGLTQDNVEYRNMEWDHLTAKEQMERFGKNYGGKRRGVSGIHTYEEKKMEAKKCMLLCILCHKLITAERRGIATSFRRYELDKLEYVKARKRETGACQSCGFKVDESNFTYFEWDHIDPTTKCKTISKIALTGHVLHTMEYLVVELSKCRLLCSFCHRLNSSKQQTARFDNERKRKLAEFKVIMEKRRLGKCYIVY